MVKDFLILFVSWLVGRFLFRVDFEKYYGLGVDFLSHHQLILLSCGTFGALSLVFIALVLRDSGSFSLLHLFSRLNFEVSQFIICLLSLFAVIFFFQLQTNLWRDLGLLTIIPFEILAASCISLHLFDFNYPFGEKLFNNLVVPAISGLVVFMVPLIMSFRP
jgi:uncharacterized membrane protein